MIAPKEKKHRQTVTVDEFLTWAYQVERIDTVVDRGGGLYPAERSAQGVDVRHVSGGSGYLPLGTKVDFSGVASGDAHPDAELVHDLICSRAFGHYQRGILFDYARTGMVPDWMPDARPTIVPRYDARGRVVVRRDSNRNPVYCPIDVQVSLAGIETMRVYYRDWWDAMRDLTYRLWAADANMTSFNIVALKKMREPWKSVLTLPKNLDTIAEEYTCA